MDIRCNQCGHIGPAAEIKPTSDGVALICANCDHPNALDVGASAPAAAPRPAATPSRDAAALKAAPPSADRQEREALTSAMLQRLIPTPGQGVRCPKCVSIVDGDDAYCAQCGLDLDGAYRHAPGDAPWERVPEAKQEAASQARLLWETTTQQWEGEHLSNYIELIQEAQLHEQGIRNLRLWLVEHPDDPLAVDALGELAKVMQTRMIIAKSHADQDRHMFHQEVTKIRTGLMVGAFVFWAGIFGLFLMLFLKNC